MYSTQTKSYGRLKVLQIGLISINIYQHKKGWHSSTQKTNLFDIIKDEIKIRAKTYNICKMSKTHFQKKHNSKIKK